MSGVFLSILIYTCFYSSKYYCIILFLAINFVKNLLTSFITEKNLKDKKSFTNRKDSLHNKGKIFQIKYLDQPSLCSTVQY